VVGKFTTRLRGWCRYSAAKVRSSPGDESLWFRVRVQGLGSEFISFNLQNRGADRRLVNPEPGTRNPELKSF
jgi:hypothetical protein